jgi:hypothetical protein
MVGVFRSVRRLALPLLVAAGVLALPISRADAADPSATSATLQFGPAVGDHWCSVLARISNPTDRSMDALLANNFESTSNIQFATRAWVPAHSVRTVNALVRIPPHANTISNGHGTPAQTLLIESAGASERRWSGDDAVFLSSGAAFHVALLDQNEDADDPLPPLLAHLLKAQNEPAATTSSTLDRLPDIAAGLDAMDVILVGETHNLPDAAQCLALRQWISAGGKLVIFTALADPRIGALILGDQWPVTPLETTHFERIELTDSNQSAVLACDPVGSMQRVIAPGFQPWISSGMWPVVAREDVGRGQVVIVTGSPNLFDRKDRLTAFGDELAYRVIEQRAAGLGEIPETIRTLNSGQVAYAIVPRATVAAVLGAAVGVLAVVGIILWTRRRLEWIAPVGVLTALVCSGVLVVLGRAHVLPLTLTSAAVATVVPEQHQLLLHGQAEIFSPTAQDAPLLSNNGPAIWPDLTNHAGELARLVRTDWNTFGWEHLALPAGAALRADVDAVITMPQLPKATGQFEGRGLRITVDPGGINTLHDLVLGGPNGNSAVSGGPTEFTVSDHDQLPPNTYVQGTLLDQAQQARQDVYRGILNGTRHPAVPLLYGWSDAPQLAAGGTVLAEVQQQVQATLLNLPIGVTQTPPHTAVSIPAAFIPFEPVRTPHGSSSTAYNMMNQQFVQGLGLGGSITLRFNLPPAVLPLQVNHAVLHVAMRASNRDIDISTTGMETPNHRTSAAGPFDVDLPVSQLAPGGTMDVTLTIGDPAEPDPANTWEIHSVSLSVDGETQ